MLVAARANSTCQVHIGHRLADQRKTVLSRVSKQLQQFGRVSGNREFLAPESNDDEVICIDCEGVTD